VATTVATPAFIGDVEGRDGDGGGGFGKALQLEKRPALETTFAPSRAQARAIALSLDRAVYRIEQVRGLVTPAPVGHLLPVA
jgi:hypothetical protein